MRGGCAIEGCTRLHHARGWCVNHYTRHRLYGDPLARIEHLAYGQATGAWVENTPIREAVVAAASNGTTYCAISRRLGWTKKNRRNGKAGDSTRLKRRVGLARESTTQTFTQMIRRDLAAEIVRAIDRDPVEFGL